MSIFSIPEGPLLNTLSYLEPKDLYSLQKVCKNFNTALTTSKVLDILWKPFCEKDGSYQPYQDSWRLRFYILHNERRGICKERFYRFSKDSLIHIEEDQIYQATVGKDNTTCVLQNFCNGETNEFKGIDFLDCIIDVTLNKDYLIVQDGYNIKVYSRATQALFDKITRQFNPASFSSITSDAQHIIYYNSWNDVVIRDIKNKCITKTFQGLKLGFLKKIGEDLLVEDHRGKIDKFINIKFSQTNQVVSFILLGKEKFENSSNNGYVGTFLARHSTKPMLAAMSKLGSLKVWDLAKDTVIFHTGSSPKPKNYDFASPCCVWLHNILFTSHSYWHSGAPPSKGSFSIIEAWDISSQKRLYEKKLHFNVHKLDVTGHQLIAHNNDGKMCIFDFSGKESKLWIPEMSKNDAWPTIEPPIMPRPTWQGVYESVKGLLWDWTHH